MSLLIDRRDLGRHSIDEKREFGERLFWLDGVRTIALLGMIVFHFARNLEIFGILPTGTTLTGSWALFARVVAGSFLCIAGLSFVLAHRHGFRPQAWLKRFLLISGAAVLVTTATFIAFPDQFIYFGILHAIGFASIVGLAFLRAPSWLTGLVALVVVVVGSASIDPLFHSAWLAWTGLSETVRPSLDFIPVVPWLGAFLFGMALAQCCPLSQLARAWRPTPLLRSLAWSGRHSLVIYLAHQPILLGLIWLTVMVQP